jgi:signal peptidase I
MKRDKIWEYTKAIGMAIVLSLIIRTSIVQAYRIPSGSMIPTLLVGDHLLANKFIYGIKIPFLDKKFLTIEKPQKGDIIIFPSPEDPGKDLIKRVVAVEGDLIEERDKQIFVNGKLSNESYVQHTDNFLSDRRDNFGPRLVPKGKVFVMGDNRDESYDSRYWGYVDIKNVKGKALIVYWSWDRERKLPRFDRLAHLIR